MKLYLISPLLYIRIVIRYDIQNIYFITQRGRQLGVGSCLLSTLMVESLKNILNDLTNSNSATMYENLLCHLNWQWFVMNNGLEEWYLMFSDECFWLNYLEELGCQRFEYFNTHQWHWNNVEEHWSWCYWILMKTSEETDKRLVNIWHLVTTANSLFFFNKSLPK